MEQRTKQANKTLCITLLINAVLMVFKFAAGIIGSSGAMLSDAVHTLSDVGTTVLAMFGVRFAGKESDAEHPYGHEKIESLIGLLLAAILAITAVLIGKDGISSLLAGGSAVTPGVIAMLAALLSIITQEVNYRLAKRTAKAIDSPALLADAWHHRSDALSSVGALIGIGAARLGAWYMEPIASLIICLLILKTAYTIGKDCVSQLIDASATPEQIKGICDTVVHVPGVMHIDSLLSRRHASKLYIDMEIAVHKDVPFTQAHAICERVHHCVESEYPAVLHCTVHANPHSDDHTEDSTLM